ncbi:MAG: hypothetical protein ACD_79C00630G0001 [uncultured bacterium]|nr:MAG: hypothetical protein ACD_79C00630G0001 [uncultured bacterium]
MFNKVFPVVLLITWCISAYSNEPEIISSELNTQNNIKNIAIFSSGIVVYPKVSSKNNNDIISMEESKLFTEKIVQYSKTYVQNKKYNITESLPVGFLLPIPQDRNIFICEKKVDSDSKFEETTVKANESLYIFKDIENHNYRLPLINLFNIVEKAFYLCSVEELYIEQKDLELLKNINANAILVNFGYAYCYTGSRKTGALVTGGLVGGVVGRAIADSMLGDAGPIKKYTANTREYINGEFIIFSFLFDLKNGQMIWNNWKNTQGDLDKFQEAHMKPNFMSLPMNGAKLSSSYYLSKANYWFKINPSLSLPFYSKFIEKEPYNPKGYKLRAKARHKINDKEGEENDEMKAKDLKKNGTPDDVLIEELQTDDLKIINKVLKEIINKKKLTNAAYDEIILIIQKFTDNIINENNDIYRFCDLSQEIFSSCKDEKIKANGFNSLIECYNVLIDKEPYNARLYAKRSKLKKSIGDKEGKDSDEAKADDLDNNGIPIDMLTLFLKGDNNDLIMTALRDIVKIKQKKTPPELFLLVEQLLSKYIQNGLVDIQSQHSEFCCAALKYSEDVKYIKILEDIINISKNSKVLKHANLSLGKLGKK